MEAFVEHLREEHRVKLLCDYAYVLKYGNIAIVAPKVWLDVLREHEGLLTGLNVQWIELPNRGICLQNEAYQRKTKETT